MTVAQVRAMPNEEFVYWGMWWQRRWQAEELEHKRLTGGGPGG